MLDVASTAIPDVKVLLPKSFSDARGTFSETWNAARFVEHGITMNFVQDNQSCSAPVGTIRGLHFQSPPKAQAKVVRVIRGRILDVAVDLRRASPTYGKWVAEELSAQNRKQLLVPIGFAHGFCTLEPDSEVLYKVTAPYSPEHERGILWSDPALAIPWPVAPERAILSDRDRVHPLFAAAL